MEAPIINIKEIKIKVRPILRGIGKVDGPLIGFTFAKPDSWDNGGSGEIRIDTVDEKYVRYHFEWKESDDLSSVFNTALAGAIAEFNDKLEIDPDDMDWYGLRDPLGNRININDWKEWQKKDNELVGYKRQVRDLEWEIEALKKKLGDEK